jgi:hypothetical protein
MNVDNGRVYTPEEADLARIRGEHLSPISEKAYHRVKSGRAILAEKLCAERRKRKNRARDKMAKRSRKAGRK